MRYKLDRKPQYLAAVESLSNNTKTEVSSKRGHFRFEIATNGWLDSHLEIELTSTLFMDKQRISVDTSEVAVEPEQFKLNEEGSCWKGIVKYFVHYFSLEHTIRNPQNATSLQQA